jgi:hypothetical protein
MSDDGPTRSAPELVDGDDVLDGVHAVNAARRAGIGTAS